MALLRAAEHAFAERGVAAVQVDDIAKSAGLTPGAFFLHFESKEAALKQIVEHWVEQVKSLFGAPGEYPDTPTDPESLVDFCVEREARLYEFFWQSRATMQIIDACEAECAYVLEAFRADMRARSREWLTMWQQDGLLRQEINVELAALLMSGAYEALAGTMLRSPTRPPIEPWLEFALDTFLRAWGTAELLAALDRRSGRSRTGTTRRVVA